jgi:hypothetical protein
MSVAPDATRKGHIDTLIGSLKTAGVWTKLDAIYIFAAHDAQAARLNWVSSSYDASAVNSPTFTTDRGYTGDGATSYLDTTFNATTAGGNFAQNSAHLAVWNGTDVVGASITDAGCLKALINARTTGSTIAVRGNAGTANTWTLPAATSVGWSCWSRDNAATFVGVKDLAAPATLTKTSEALQSMQFFGLAFSNSGTPTNYSSRRMQALHFGGAIDDTERDATYNALATYMTAVGA